MQLQIHALVKSFLSFPQCSTEDALDSFFKGVFSQNSILAFLGSACPKAVQPIAELVHRWNISEVKYAYNCQDLVTLKDPLRVKLTRYFEGSLSNLPLILRLS